MRPLRVPFPWKKLGNDKARVVVYNVGATKSKDFTAPDKYQWFNDKVTRSINY